MGPFTNAILYSSLEDILREADEAEYGLFTFVKDSLDGAGDNVGNQGKVGKREFKGATPLRTRRVAGAKDEEPEVYVEAALKYIDRFRSVKSMPHMRSRLEDLIGRLNCTRDSMEKLQDSFQQLEQGGRASPKTQIAEEERRISELKSRIMQLRKRKEALSAKVPATSKTKGKVFLRLPQSKSKLPSPLTSNASPSSVASDSPSQVTPRKSIPKPKATTTSKTKVSSQSTKKTRSPMTPQTSQDEAEALFWSGGKPPSVLAHTSASLLEEEMDMTGMDSLMSPSPTKKLPVNRPPLRQQEQSKLESNQRRSSEDSGSESLDDDGEDELESGEPTIVVSKLAPRQEPLQPAAIKLPPSEPPSRSSSQISQASSVEPQTPVQVEKQPTVPPSTKTKVKRIRITSETERICAKIWSTLADLLVPGNNFLSRGRQPPNAKDTITVLQTIASQPIPDPAISNASSPSTRSTLSSILGIEILGPAANSPHQILTAEVLLTLLTVPNHIIPHSALKARLSEKAVGQSPGSKQTAAAMAASAAVTRALYGCVAKKIIEIDRSSREQLVRFKMG